MCLSSWRTLCKESRVNTSQLDFPRVSRFDRPLLSDVVFQRGAVGETAEGVEHLGDSVICGSGELDILYEISEVVGDEPANMVILLMSSKRP